MRKLRYVSLLVIVLVFGGYALIAYYPYIFSRRVVGEIVAVEKALPSNTYVSVSGQDPSPDIFSFAVGIRDGKTGEIVTASTEDRQWAVAKPGLCAEAQFFPYPPWRLDNWGTYYNARLIKLMDCEPKK